MRNGERVARSGRSVRDWGKHQIYERIREIAVTRPPTTADVDVAWADIRARLARALGET
jgi:hypothetical protein